MTRIKLFCSGQESDSVLNIRQRKRVHLKPEQCLSGCPSAFGLWLLSISVIYPVLDVVPFSLVHRYEHFIGTCLLSFSTLKNEEAHTYEMLASVYQIIQCYILQDCIFKIDNYDNLKISVWDLKFTWC